MNFHDPRDDAPHAPTVAYLCDDYECCDNGCPDVRCKACRQEWPCPGWRERHTRRQIEAQVRYTARKHFPGDPDMWERMVRRYEHYPPEVVQGDAHGG